MNKLLEILKKFNSKSVEKNEILPELEFKILRTVNKELYNEVLKWDTDETYDTNRNQSLMEAELEIPNPYRYHVTCYIDDNFIGYGEIVYFPSTGYRYKQTSEYTEISVIINPMCRNNGYGKKLVEYLCGISIKEFYCSNIKVQILKENISSITMIENSDFSLEKTDSEKLYFYKKYEL